jgi:hypothetical protein
MKLDKQDIEKILFAVSNPKIKDERLQRIYQLGVLAAWMYRLSRADMTIRQELDSRLDRRKSQERK